MSSFPLRGLYAITAAADPPYRRLLEDIEAAIGGGAVVVQYRDKSTDQPRRHEEAAALAELCRREGVCFIVNDDVELAAAVGADGVHLGRDDPPLAAARHSLGVEAIIGVSCYAQIDRALDAQASGASYVAFGRFFDSRTKPFAVHASTEILREARLRVHLPIVAIGGITPDNGADLLDAGADLLAVSHGLFGGESPKLAARRFAELFQPLQERT